tara:strand:+ start:772 stop:1200 length:429 start_codon:yes stop_codon:yes gene_type:complete
MENSINFSIFLPTFPLGMAVFLFILLRLFNRTINRLTKPVSFLTLISIISSILLSLFYFSNNVEGDLDLPKYLIFLENTNLQIHLNALTEKFIILIGTLSALIIIFSVIKLPRRNGYVMYIVSIGFITSLLIFSSLIYGFNI